jgi:hypothetical protein
MRKMVAITIAEYETIQDLLYNAIDNIRLSRYPTAIEMIHDVIDILKAIKEESDK